MRLCFFDDSRLGLVESDRVHDVTAALDALPAGRYPYPRHDAPLPELRHMIKATGPGVPIGSVRLHSPVANPGKIVGAPVNYQNHLDEAIADTETFSRVHVRTIQETGLFLKATSSLIGPLKGVRLRHPDRRTDHEVKLAAIIGVPCQNVAAANAMRHVAGYAIGLDITIRGRRSAACASRSTPTPSWGRGW